MIPKEFFDKYIGAEIERIYHIPNDDGGFKLVTLCFKGGDSLRIEPTYVVSTKGLVPSVKLTEAKWDLVKAEESKEPGTPDLKMLDGANQD